MKLYNIIYNICLFFFDIFGDDLIFVWINYVGVYFFFRFLK